MKKILLLLATLGLLMGVIACGDENDGPQRGNGVFTVNTAMINHIYNTHADKALELSATHNRLTLDTVNHKATLELNYNDGNSDQTLKLNDLTAKPKRLGFYVLSSPSDATFSGYVDFNEATMRYQYTTSNGLRVISTTPDVFFLYTENTITYDDTTQTTHMQNVMYQFDIEQASKTAIVKVMSIVHAKDMKFFNNITAYSVPYTVTTNGFTLSGSNIATTAYYRSYVDSTKSTVAQTNKYPFKTFNATVDLANDHLDANFKLGDSATVVATGRTYPDYTSY